MKLFASTIRSATNNIKHTLLYLKKIKFIFCTRESNAGHTDGVSCVLCSRSYPHKVRAVFSDPTQREDEEEEVARNISCKHLGRYFEVKLLPTSSPLARCFTIAFIFIKLHLSTINKKVEESYSSTSLGYS